MARKETIKPEHTFTCLLCKDGEPLEMSDFKKHREDAHGATEHKGRRKTSMHLDGKDWFAWAYEWVGEDDVPFASEYVKQPRRGLDKAMWTDH